MSIYQPRKIYVDPITLWIDFQVKKANTKITYMYVQAINRK